MRVRVITSAARERIESGQQGVRELEPDLVRVRNRARVRVGVGVRIRVRVRVGVRVRVRVTWHAHSLRQWRQVY